MLQISHELPRVKFMGPSLARLIPHLSPVRRAFVGVDLHHGELIRPTVTQVAHLVRVSPSYVHHALKRTDEERAFIEDGQRPLVPAAKLALPAPAAIGDQDLVLLAASVGTDRWLSAATQAGL